MPKLDETDTAFEEAASDQQLTRVNTGAVHRANRLGLFSDVERVGSVHLHAVSKFEGLDAGFEARFGLSALLVLAIEALEQIELAALVFDGGVVVADVFDELFDGSVLGIEVGALKNTGEKG